MLKFIALFFLMANVSLLAKAQPAYAPSSIDIYNDISKLGHHPSVLYIAAHPDDENTRLLAWLANEKKYRTAYLSLTRGDGGQNLIGNQQGIELGLIRTQELLAARRIDGAQQFFSRAYDFGYSKSPKETLEFWGHERILSDVVFIIRYFKPDVIITRFPTTGEGGHGHHTASAILAGEAFDAAADPKRFPEHNLPAWSATRLLWNTFNFGGTNTQSESQLKINVGAFNPLLGKGYGEIAAASRSMHKSQGFGVSATRGNAVEYFKLIKGTNPEGDLMSGISQTLQPAQLSYMAMKDSLLSSYNFRNPTASLPLLLKLKSLASQSFPNDIAKIDEIITSAAGLFVEVSTKKQNNFLGDSIQYRTTAVNRSNLKIENLKVAINGVEIIMPRVDSNNTITKTYDAIVSDAALLTQPIWLRKEMGKGFFDLSQNNLPNNSSDVMQAQVSYQINGEPITITRPIVYKNTDPVKGELINPSVISSDVLAFISPSVLVFSNEKDKPKTVHLTITANKALPTSEANIEQRFADGTVKKLASIFIPALAAGSKFESPITVSYVAQKEQSTIHVKINGKAAIQMRQMNFDHLPTITYHSEPVAKVVQTNVQVAGRRAGYIVGAGDLVPEALHQLGYEVVVLHEDDFSLDKLKTFSVIIAGVRAYNTVDWLPSKQNVIADYVRRGGVYAVQYNTNSFVGALKTSIFPMPMGISRNRVTDENAVIDFLIPNHPLLNYPNKITAKDFEGWVQERSIYHAENFGSEFQNLLAMKDEGEEPKPGALVSVDYGKGRYVYTGLSLFRQLPAGVSGAYRLFANLIANPNYK